MSGEQCRIRFWGSLGDFLSDERYSGWVQYPLDGRVAVKHAVEALGVPHVEIEQIVVEGSSVTFSHILADGEDVEVYPQECDFSTNNRVMLRPVLTHPVRFVLDTHLGRLAAYLRMLGIDSVYGNRLDDAELAKIAESEGRVLLTRDRGLLKRSSVVYGYCVRETAPLAQLTSVVRRYDLGKDAAPWSRCVRCNGLLKSADKADILDRLEPKTKLYYGRFQICDSCGQIYWRGSHFERMQSVLQTCLAEAGANLRDTDVWRS